MVRSGRKTDCEDLLELSSLVSLGLPLCRVMKVITPRVLFMTSSA
jgi:hypothetical protein